jgi:hypothetical protein
MDTRIDTALADAALAIEESALKNEKEVSSGTIFSMKYVKHFLILLSIKYIRNKGNTIMKLAKATYRVPCFSMCCIEGLYGPAGLSNEYNVPLNSKCR